MSEKKAVWERGPFTLYRRELKIVGSSAPTKSQVQGAAREILTFRDAGAWGIGDLVNFAEAQGKGEAVEEIANELVRDQQMVRKCHYVSKAVAPEDRRFDLWWNFYFAVYTVPAEHRNKLLQLCVDEKWSLDEFKHHVRGMKHSVRQQLQSFPVGQYGLVLIDPPWKYENGAGVNGAAEQHYPTLTTDEIRNFKDGSDREMADVCAKDCIMYMWATNPFLEDAIDIAKGMGFEYKTNMVWVKDRQGTGYWARGRHELLLIFTRGDVVTPAEGVRPDSVMQYPIPGDHSKKPVEVYEMLETMYAHLPKIEIFARSGREGWESFGNQLPSGEVTGDGTGDALPDVDPETGDVLEAGEEQAQRDSPEEVKAKARGVGKKKSAGKPRLVKGKSKAAAHAATTH